jgi:hypothetical protein
VKSGWGGNQSREVRFTSTGPTCRSGPKEREVPMGSFGAFKPECDSASPRRWTVPGNNFAAAGSAGMARARHCGKATASALGCCAGADGRKGSGRATFRKAKAAKL